MRSENTTLGLLFVLVSLSVVAGFAERPCLATVRRNLALVTRPYRQTDDWTTVDGPMIRIDQLVPRTKDRQVFPRPELFDWHANQNLGSVAGAPAEIADPSGFAVVQRESASVSPMTSLRQSIGSSVMQLGQSYSELCERKPLITKSLSAAILAVLGSLLSQRIEAHMAHKVFQSNWNHLASFFLYGCLFQGPFCHLWYQQLWKFGRWLENTHGCSSRTKTLTQVLINQTLGTVLFLPSCFYAFEYCEALVNLRAPVIAIATSKLRESIASVLLMQYYVWPFVNWVNFTYVPESLRDMLNSVVSIFWNAYLCVALV